jgi:hypothetical protein
MPQQAQGRSFLIATKTVSAEVYVFGTDNYAHQAHGHKPSGEEECRPSLRLTGKQQRSWLAGATLVLLTAYCAAVTETGRALVYRQQTASRWYDIIVVALCAGHKAEGYGLSWSHLREGHLLSGSDDTLVCTWDINAMPRDGRVSKVSTSKHHLALVNVQRSMHQEGVCVACWAI